MARPQVADGGDGLKICRVAEIVLNMQSRKANKGWFSSFGNRIKSNNSSPRQSSLLRIVTQGLGFGSG